MNKVKIIHTLDLLISICFMAIVGCALWACASFLFWLTIHTVFQWWSIAFTLFSIVSFFILFTLNAYLKAAPKPRQQFESFSKRVAQYHRQKNLGMTKKMYEDETPN